MDRSLLTTSATRLLDLRDAENHQAWHDFYRLYRGLIIGYARSQGCSSDLSQEVLQETMIALFRTLPGFDYDRTRGRFRSYLFRVVRSSIVAAWRRQRRSVRAAGQTDTSAGADVLADIPDDQAEAAGAAWDRRWEQAVLAQALVRIRGKISETTFRSFTKYVLEERPVEDVCRELGLSPNTVYQHRNRVVTLLRDEVTTIRAELGETET